MHRLRIIDNNPIATYLATLVTVIVVIAGAIVTCTDAAFSFTDYALTLAILTLGHGLLGIGRGLNEYGKQRAGAEALQIAYDRGLRPRDPDAQMPPPPPDELAQLSTEDNFADDKTRFTNP